MNCQIAPSILSADFADLATDLRRMEAAGGDWVHCDIMDGNFVPNISFGPIMVEVVNRITDLPLDVHLMITEPIRYLEAFVKAGADLISFHADACTDLSATIRKCKELGVKVGVAVNPDKPIELFLPYLEELDLVLIMSVYAGFGGQVFLPETMSKVTAIAEAARTRNPSLLIQVDGGVNGETAKICRDAGANMLVAGSYLFGKSDMAERIAGLRG